MLGRSGVGLGVRLVIHRRCDCIGDELAVQHVCSSSFQVHFQLSLRHDLGSDVAELTGTPATAWKLEVGTMNLLGSLKAEFGTVSQRLVRPRRPSSIGSVIGLIIGLEEGRSSKGRLLGEGFEYVRRHALYCDDNCKVILAVGTTGSDI